jgi:prepilin-type N-terminal cleavage/methylation domain-containing protein
MNPTQPNARRCDAFTLMEMLVVIAVIGILAAMIIGIFPGVQEKKVRNRVRAELMALTSAIENFKHDQGFYPPDNKNSAAGSPLFYELVGCTVDNTQFMPAIGTAVPINRVQASFGVDGFVNTSVGNKRSKNYLSDLKDDQHGTLTNSPPTPVEVLLVPYKGVTNDFNPWRYNSSSPVHNPGSYDLWAEIDLGKKDKNNKPFPVIIGNWRQ